MPGSLQGVHLVVYAIEKAREDIASRGVEISEVFHDTGGVFYHTGDAHRASGAHPERADYASFASFSDADGNGWLLQEVSTAPGR